MRHKDGYIIIGEQAYGTKEAHNIALKDVDYFQEHDKHLPPLPYPATPDLKKQYYPDVTKEVYKELDRMAAIVMTTEPLMRIALMETNFKDDNSWDLQVNYGLPGQVSELNLYDNEPLKDDFDKVKTTDQHAIFDGQIRPAGYLSNYAYGYVSAAAGIEKNAMEQLAQLVSIKNKFRLDNPRDIEAMKAGWESWHFRYKKIR